MNEHEMGMANVRINRRDATMTNETERNELAQLIADNDETTSYELADTLIEAGYRKVEGGAG